jgi:hypothetical protein
MYAVVVPSAPTTAGPAPPFSFISFISPLDFKERNFKTLKRKKKGLNSHDNKQQSRRSND